MNFKTTIILAVLLVVVGVVFFVTRGDGDEETQTGHGSTTADKGQPFLTADDMSTSAVMRVDIQRGDQKIVFEKEDGKWWQIAPVRFPLDDLSGGLRFVDAAAAMRYSTREIPGKNKFPSLDELGLAEPRAIVTLYLENDPDAKTQYPEQHVIKIGRKVGSQSYAMLNDDDHVYVVNNRLYDPAVDDEVSSWRSKNVALPQASRAKAITIKSPLNPQGIELVRKDGEWTLSGDQRGRADRQVITQMLTNSPRIVSFEDGGSADASIYGLNDPTAEVRIQTTALKGDEQTTHLLRIGRPASPDGISFFATWINGDKPAENQKAVFVIGKADVDRFNKPVDDFRDPRATPVKALDVQQIAFNRPNLPDVKLVKETSWKFEQPEVNFTPDTSFINTVLAAMTEATATHYTPDAAPQGNPIATIRLDMIGRTEPEVLRIFEVADNAGQYMVLRNDETTGYHVSAAAFKSALEPALTFRSRRVLDKEPDGLTKVAVRRPDGVVYEFLREQNESVEGTSPTARNAWRLKGHTSFEAAALANLLPWLTPLDAAAWVSDSGKTAGIEVTLTFGDDTERLVIDPESREATLDSVADGVFQVKQELLDALQSEFRNRTILNLSRGAVTAITVTKEDAAITVKHDGGEFGSGQGLVNQQAAGAMFEAFTPLRIERYLPASAARNAKEVETITVNVGEDRRHTIAMLELADGQVALRLDDGETIYTIDNELLIKLTSDLLVSQ